MTTNVPLPKWPFNTRFSLGATAGLCDDGNPPLALASLALVIFCFKSAICCLDIFLIRKGGGGGRNLYTQRAHAIVYILELTGER